MGKESVTQNIWWKKIGQFRLRPTNEEIKLYGESNAGLQLLATC